MCICTYLYMYIYIVCIHRYVNMSTQIDRRRGIYKRWSRQCCSVLQCVAVCCSVLQCVAVCCSVLQCDAVCCSVWHVYQTNRRRGACKRWNRHVRCLLPLDILVWPFFVWHYNYHLLQSVSLCYFFDGAAKFDVWYLLTPLYDLFLLYIIIIIIIIIDDFSTTVLLLS